MDKAKLWAYMLLALLCVAVSLVLLLVFYHTPAIPPDLAGYDYFAITTPTGEEHVFAKGEESFAVAAVAFGQATPVALPDSLGEALFLTADWIRGGRSHTYRLYLSPLDLTGYAVDERENAYLLPRQRVLFLLQQDYSSALLVGQDPPMLTVGQRSIPFALCQWTYTLEGGAVLSSGEYRNTEGGTYPIDAAVFTPQFSKAPNSTIYTIYLGADEVFSGEALPDLASLPAGDYQLVLVAEWQEEAVRIRAGYSLLFSL